MPKLDATVIRPARLADAAVLCEAERAVVRAFDGLLVSEPDELSETAQAERIAMQAGGSAKVVVAEREGEPVAHASLYPRGLRKVAHVLSLDMCVHLGHWGQGLGTLLLQDLLGWARNHPTAHKVELLVRSTNLAAIALYERAGFVHEGRHKDRVRLRDGRFVDDLGMALMLRDGGIDILPATFETGRLTARLPEPADAAALFAAYTADPRVSRFMVWRPHATVRETEAFVAGCIAAANAGTRLPYVLSERHTGAVVGMLEARPSGHTVDLGYVLAPRAWGHGYMPEAVSALAQLALSRPGIFRVQAFCDVENIPSQRTLEKAGFVREGRHERFAVHPNLSPEPRTCFMYGRCR